MSMLGGVFGRGSHLLSRWVRRDRVYGDPPRSFDGHPRRPIRVGAILDEFSWACFAPEVELVALDPRRWQRQLDDGIDLLLVESAWSGNGGQWRYEVAYYGDGERRQLPLVLAHAARSGIPAVFWNKEDPPNFDLFAPAAREFTNILTTASECIPRYQLLRPGSKVQVLPFAAQSLLHHPDGGADECPGRVCFAGSWRGAKYAGRADDLQMLLGAPLAMGVLDIFDRNAGGEEGLAFPEPFVSAVRGALPYDRMVDAYRAYDAFLNVNSTDASPTMLSRRVFEILACGTPVVSTPSAAIEEFFGDLVVTVSDAAAAREAISELLADPEARRRRGHLGYRHVHTHHTYRHRMDSILALADIDPPPQATPTVVAFGIARTRHEFDSLRRAIDRQQRPPSQLVVLVPGDSADLAAIAERIGTHPGCSLEVTPRDVTEVEGLRIVEERTAGAYIAALHPAHGYGPHYLGDALLAFEFCRTAVVGKNAHYFLEGAQLRLSPGKRFMGTQTIVEGTAVVEVASWRQSMAGGTPPPGSIGDAATSLGITPYAIDPYGFVRFGSGSVDDASRTDLASEIGSRVFV